MSSELQKNQKPDGTDPAIEAKRLPPELRDFAEALDPKVRTAFIATFQSSSSYSGPLPPAKALADYESACQGAARDIVNMAMAEQQSRHKSADAELRIIGRGQSFGILAFTMSMVACCFLGFYGAPVAASVMGSSAVTVFGAAFLLARHRGRPASAPSPAKTPPSAHPPSKKSRRKGKGSS